MRLKAFNFKWILSITVFALLYGAISSSVAFATPSVTKPSLLKKVSLNDVTLNQMILSLKKSSKANFNVSYLSDSTQSTFIENLKIENSKRFTYTDGYQNIIFLDGYRYQPVDAISKVILEHAGKKNIKWIKDQTSYGLIDAVTSSVALDSLYANLAKGKIVNRLNNMISVVYSIPPDTYSNSSGGVYTITLDEYGRVTQVDSKTTCVDSSIGCFGFDNQWIFFYSTIALKPFPSSAVIDRDKLDSLPTLNTLENAAYDILSKINSIPHYGDRFSIKAEIDSATMMEPDETGLLSYFTSTGVRLTYEGKSLCIDPSEDGTKALVTVCQTIIQEGRK